MQWCQPVWAPIPETAVYFIEGNISPLTGIGRGLARLIPDEFRSKPIMVTTHIGGGSGKGRDYGSLVLKDTEAYSLDGEKYDNSNYQCESILETYSHNNRKTPRQKNNSNRPHQGIDYYANDESTTYNSSEKTSPVFAIHGGQIGTLLSRPSANSHYGLQYEVRIGQFKPSVYAFYGHLDKKDITINANWTNIVMAGRKIGNAGRTYGTDLSDPKFKSAPTHLHFEMRIEAWNRRIVDPKYIFQLSDESVDSENTNLLLGIEGNRLFPCDCNNGNYRAYRCYLRNNDLPNANDKNIANDCWASRNLHCPYLLNPGNETFLLQAQLRFLHDNDNNRYESPGDINGELGPNPVSEVVNLRQGDTVVWIRTRSKLHLFARDGVNLGWVRKHLVTQVGDTPNYTINRDLSTVLSNCEGSWDTRIALYKLREEHDLLTFENYHENFEVDPQVLQLLNGDGTSANRGLAECPRADLNRVDT